MNFEDMQAWRFKQLALILGIVAALAVPYVAYQVGTTHGRRAVDQELGQQRFHCATGQLCTIAGPFDVCRGGQP